MQQYKNVPNFRLKRSLTCSLSCFIFSRLDNLSFSLSKKKKKKSLFMYLPPTPKGHWRKHPLAHEKVLYLAYQFTFSKKVSIL